MAPGQAPARCLCRIQPPASMSITEAAVRSKIMAGCSVVSGVFCRNGPKGASHKRLPTDPFLPIGSLALSKGRMEASGGSLSCKIL